MADSIVYGLSCEGGAEHGVAQPVGRVVLRFGVKGGGHVLGLDDARGPLGEIGPDGPGDAP